MKQLFVEQPNLELKVGIMVHKDTELTYKNDKVEQVIKELKMETILDDEGTNGINTYKSKSYLSITLNPGDILLFDEGRGYYMPAYPMSTIEDAISDITSLEDMAHLMKEEGNEHDITGNEEESTATD